METKRVLIFVMVLLISLNLVLLVSGGDIINSAGETADVIANKLSALEKEISTYSSKNLPLQAVDDYFVKAKLAFEQQRFEEADNYIEQAKQSLAKAIEYPNILVLMGVNILNFFQTYWIYILGLLVVLFIIITVLFRRLSLKLLKNKIHRLKLEEKATEELIALMEKEEKSENSFKQFVNNLKLNRYKSRLPRIKENLRFSQAKLKILTR